MINNRTYQIVRMRSLVWAFEPSYIFYEANLDIIYFVFSE